MMFLLFIFGLIILDFSLSIIKNKKNRKTYSLLLWSFILLIAIIIGIRISVFPLFGIPIGVFITKIISKIVKNKKNK
jgi:hypothetical protein